MGEYFFERNALTFKSALSFPIDLNLPAAEKAAKHAAKLALEWPERVLAMGLTVLISPLLLATALIVKLSSHGPVLYKQIRVGKEGNLFPIFKFRSMVVDAEAKTGPVLSSRSDSRVTFVGKILRNTHLDELPQLFNIARGEMAFIGPRPERPEFVNRFAVEIPSYALRSRVKPGISGLAQVCGSYDASAEEKLTYDLIYLAHRGSLKLNLFILYNTLKKVVVIRFNK